MIMKSKKENVLGVFNGSFETYTRYNGKNLRNLGGHEAIISNLFKIFWMTSIIIR